MSSLGIKDLLGIKGLSRKQIYLVLDTAAGFKDVLKRDIKKVPALRGKTVFNLFFEPSTRTRTSFELAAKRLSTDVINFSVPTSSFVKGESLLDTIRTIESYGVDYIVIRHSSSGVPHFIARHSHASVVNAGDGINEHPTQALLDAFTIKEKKGYFEGLKIAIVGDILHSRVAKSNIYCLRELGAELRIVAPPTFVPHGIDSFGVEVYFDADKGLKDVDVIMMLRIQNERQEGGFLPSSDEYSRFWGLTEERLARASQGAVVMHPGPMNRGVEIMSEVADSTSSVILEQVTNGVAVRMAVLYLLNRTRVTKHV
ncbi:aspartate carbamoyltransferase [bacterium BMS3Abin07]|nr:aspartate carbamoyltransferase [bacterium BMS3Abin07]GBE33320.1 aspartate carbamoyltransferase [bacterium BMS3Bbin05]HDL21306.1 aspartate carbamoyltransferase catalytic subunit [Nitrospirota bacterium]HDO22225.1 aspartate carbamoyltransferase catalytic subunit [Nitrospirota bacterium]HDZ88044.1 aspartate carbamoyltransferase catalytic subunit [Nitrospirota bacterium]